MMESACSHHWSALIFRYTVVFWVVGTQGMGGLTSLFLEELLISFWTKKKPNNAIYGCTGTSNQEAPIKAARTAQVLVRRSYLETQSLEHPGTLSGATSQGLHCILYLYIWLLTRDAGNWTRDLLHAKQTLHHLSHTLMMLSVIS